MLCPPGTMAIFEPLLWSFLAEIYKTLANFHTVPRCCLACCMANFSFAYDVQQTRLAWPALSVTADTC